MCKVSGTNTFWFECPIIVPDFYAVLYQGNEEEEEETNMEAMDMYTRVKRQRRKIKRDMYGMPLVDQEEEKSTEDEETEEEEDEEEVGLLFLNPLLLC